MTMPPVDPGAAALASFQLPPAADRRQKAGSLFTVALLAAGKDGCACRSCQILTKLRDQMVEEVEADIDAPNG